MCTHCRGSFAIHPFSAWRFLVTQSSQIKTSLHRAPYKWFDEFKDLSTLMVTANVVEIDTL